MHTSKSFSKMKLVKTRLRNRLCAETLDEAMRPSIERPKTLKLMDIFVHFFKQQKPMSSFLTSNSNLMDYVMFWGRGGGGDSPAFPSPLDETQHDKFLVANSSC